MSRVASSTRSIRRRVFEIMEIAVEGDPPSRVFDVSILVLISLNVVALVLGTVPRVAAAAPHLLRRFEIASVGVFTLEYLLRLWGAPEDPRHGAGVRGRLRFMTTPLAVVDLLAILPFYIPMLGIDLRFLRVVRVLRVFRIAKLGRYSRALRTMGTVCRSRAPEMWTLVLVLAMLLIMASCLMYFAEHDAQPDVFASIPAAMWWGMITLTTVGYGDVCPVTVAGKLLGGVIALLGIGVFALPAGLLGSAFVEELQKDKTATKCPHCGGDLGPG